MNYNNVQFRLKTIYSSIQQKFEYEDMVLKRMKSTTSTNGNIFTTIISLEKDEYELRNKINNIIFNLANLKDCLKEKISEKGLNKKIIESEINNSFCLQVVIDLANQEKHGYPLKQTRRSLKDPLIQNINLGLTGSNRKKNVRIESSDGSMAQNIMTTILADITDSKGNFLYKLDELINNAISDWEKIIKKYNIT